MGHGKDANKGFLRWCFKIKLHAPRKKSNMNIQLKTHTVSPCVCVLVCLFVEELEFFFVLFKLFYRYKRLCFLIFTFIFFFWILIWELIQRKLYIFVVWYEAMYKSESRQRKENVRKLFEKKGFVKRNKNTMHNFHIYGTEDIFKCFRMSRTLFVFFLIYSFLFPVSLYRKQCVFIFILYFFVRT